LIAVLQELISHGIPMVLKDNLIVDWRIK